ncbi:MAG: hypothetical protein HC918_09725 [Oscillatoriales cyanobacterium SM2_1_8]|nr:hypothetical protein [Oscillatoriales cyanobacterium SM2_1_8]
MATVQWVGGSSDPNNDIKLGQIGQWWSALNGHKVSWKQRQLPPSGQPAGIVWDTDEQFDEVFAIQSPSLRGLTLYWFKPGSDSERNLTVAALTLDPELQELTIYPASGRDYLIRVASFQVIYQGLTLQNPEVAASVRPSGEAILLLRDEGQKLEVQVNLSPDRLQSLRAQLR